MSWVIFSCIEFQITGETLKFDLIVFLFESIDKKFVLQIFDCNI